MALTAYITTVGAQLISECVGDTMILTGAKLGTGGSTDETACRALTDVVSYAADAEIAGASHIDGATKVTVSYTNTAQSGSLAVREIGIFAKKNGGSPVLLCYANFGVGDEDVIQAAQAAQFLRLYEIVIAVAGVASVTVTAATDVYQEAITLSAYPAILKATGAGSIVAAVAGTDYAAPVHTHDASNIVSGVLPVARGGTGSGVAGAQTGGALNNLGIIYSSETPTVVNGYIWLKPVS